MKNRLIQIIFLNLLFVFGSFAQQSPYTKDFHIWNDLQLTIPLIKGKDAKDKTFDKIALVVDGIVRLGRDTSYPVDDRMSASVEFRINKFFKVSTGYLYQRFEEVPKLKSYESRFTLAGFFEHRIKNYTFKHRSLFEYKFRNSRTDQQIYRSRFAISHPLNFHKKEICSFFVSDEPYYDMTAKIWNRNEFFAGITRKINKNLAVDLYYLNQESKNGLPRIVNGLGMTLKVRID